MAYQKSETQHPRPQGHQVGPETPKVPSSRPPSLKMQFVMTSLNPSMPKFPFLYPLKTENHKFCGVFRRFRKGRLGVNGFQVYVGIRMRLDAKFFLKNSYLLASNDCFMLLYILLKIIILMKAFKSYKKEATIQMCLLK